MTKISPARLLTIEDITDLHQVSTKTVRQWIKAQELPAAKLGNQWRILRKDIDLFVERLS